MMFMLIILFSFYFSKDVIITQDYIIVLKGSKHIIVPKIKSRPIKPKGENKWVSSVDMCGMKY